MSLNAPVIAWSEIIRQTSEQIEWQGIPAGLCLLERDTPLFGVLNPLVPATFSLITPAIRAQFPLHPEYHQTESSQAWIYSGAEPIAHSHRTLGVSPLDAAALMQWLLPRTLHWRPWVAVHGTLIRIFGQGLLLCGPPAVGKSTLAWHLLDRGHQLISDDIVHLCHVSGQVVGYRPFNAPKLLHCRTFGFIDPARTFGENAIQPATPIHMIVALAGTAATLSEEDYINGCVSTQYYFGVSLKKYHISVQSVSDSASLLESLVRHSPIAPLAFTEQFVWN